MTTSKYFPVFSAVFVTLLIVSNIIAVKIGTFGKFFLPVAVVVFPITYIIADVVTEVYGFAAMRKTIWLGFLCNLLAVGAIWIGSKIPYAPFVQDIQSYDQIFGFTPRLLIASFIAYLIGEFTNSFILAKMKVKTKGKYLWMRTIGSTIVGEGLDSAIFITIAFYGIFPNAQLGTVILTQWAFKVLFEIIATPITYGVVGFVKKKENMDMYDEHMNFNPVKI